MQARGGTKMLTHSAVSATDFLFCLIVSASSSAAFVYKGCNETIEYSNINLNHKEPYRLIMSEQMTIRWNSSADSKFFHCWVRFQDSSRKVVEISVKEIISTDQDKDSCKTSYLKISEWSTLDSKSNRDWLPVATVCSANRNRKSTRVRRWIRSPNAFVDFKYERPKQTGSYEFDVMFVNNDDDDKPLPYGHNERVEGKIQHTECDWLIPVEECIGYCSVISPGYPNSYPDDVTCSYLLTNFDDSRVELKIGGKHFSGVFDLKQSDNCTEDYVQVYDGMSASNPLIGQFCGQFDSQNGLHLISSGSSLFMIFRTSSNSASGSDVPDDAPTRNSHSGFHFQAMERWKNYHENGKRKSNSICDWVFRSSDSISGDLHTPDYFLRGETTCRYDFVGVDSNDRTEVHIVIQHFQNSLGSSPSSCKEIVRIFDGSHEVKTLCRTVDVGCRRSELSTEIVDGGCRPEEYVHNMTHRNASVIFHRVSGQLSNPDPTWIYYRFWRQPVATTTTEPCLHTIRRDFEKDYVQLDLRFVSKTSEEDMTHVRSSYSLYPGRPSNEDFLGDINSASNSQNSAYAPIFRIFYALSISQLLTATLYTDLTIYLQQFHHLRQFHHRISSG